jgi:hypothetical protein
LLRCISLLFFDVYPLRRRTWRTGTTRGLILIDGSGASTLFSRSL